jgi:hypothetical protein
VPEAGGHEGATKWVDRERDKVGREHDEGPVQRIKQVRIFIVRRQRVRNPIKACSRSKL